MSLLNHLNNKHPRSRFTNVLEGSTSSSCWIFLVVAILLGLVSGGTDALTTRWLAVASTLASIDHIQDEATCDHLSGLISRQIQICKRNVELMDSVRSGAADAIDECQFQFRNRRWNCSTMDADNVFGGAVAKGTREAAFVSAISAAGVTHAVTAACSSGELYQCGCDHSRSGVSSEDYVWGRCSDNINYGLDFSRTFSDALEIGRREGRLSGARALMNLHNNEAGRKAIEEHMRLDCRCHGVSGSCNLRTCWNAMPTFREVGDLLKEKFDGAVLVRQIKIAGRRQLTPRNSVYKPQTASDLVYLDDSIDFCEPDADTGSLGTHGRTCNRAAQGIDGCDLLCCGRGYNSRWETIVERCNCKFYWCCYAKCRVCRNDVLAHSCK